MGYRLYLGAVTKDRYTELCNMTKEELFRFKGKDPEDEYAYVGPYDIPTTNLFEFGKYIEFGDKKFFGRFFNNEELNDFMTNEHDFWKVDKSFLRHIIEYYAEEIKKWYLEMLPPLDKYGRPDGEPTDEQRAKQYDHVLGFYREWTLGPFNLDKGDEVTTSWKWEYNMFEYVRLYKHFDFDNHVLIYYGY